MKKIAKELLKIAKQMIAKQKVADKVGEYANFTGEIFFNGTRAKVKNAFFDLTSKGEIYWYDGYWIDGYWIKGTWEDGIWYDGVWQGGIWQGGEWKDGTWQFGVWQNGEWQDGVWQYGAWQKGTWKNGIWQNGVMKGGTWEHGTWVKGLFAGDIWKDGFWMKGTWKRGKWMKGQDSKGNKHQKGDSPDKWGNVKTAKNIKSFGAFGDEDLAIDLKEDIIDLIKKKKATESNVKNLVNRYDKVKYDYLDIDLVIDELDQFAKFNEKYEDEVNKVCKILQKI